MVELYREFNIPFDIPKKIKENEDLFSWSENLKNSRNELNKNVLLLYNKTISGLEKKYNIKKKSYDKYLCYFEGYKHNYTLYLFQEKNKKISSSEIFKIIINVKWKNDVGRSVDFCIGDKVKLKFGNNIIEYNVLNKYYKNMWMYTLENKRGVKMNVGGDYIKKFMVN